jgi:putative methyltransferase (TIGR04325 family)
LKNFLKFLIPSFILNKYHKLRYSKETIYGWSGDYSSWDEVAKLSTGYNDDEIFSKVDKGITEVINGNASFERDSIAFKELIYSEELLKLFNSISDEHNKQLCLIDFGGSLGSIYYQYKKLLKNITINWSVVEQGKFVEIGKKKYSNTEINFYNSIEDALNIRNHDVLFMSSVLAYLKEPEAFLKQITSYNIKYIILYRTAFVHREKHLLTIQHVPPQVYKASYPSWFLNEDKIKSILNQKYILVNSFNGDIETELNIDENKCYWKCLVFKLKK